MRKLIILVITLFICSEFYAQGLGIMTGFTSSKQSIASIINGEKHGMSDNLDPVTSVSFGFNYDFELMENLYLELGIFYTQKGWMIKGDGGYIKDQIHYLNIPFLAKYKYEVGDEIYIMGMGGMEFGMVLGGKGILKIGDEKTSDNLEIGYDKNDDYIPLDLGIYLGAGVEYKRIEFRFAYTKGIMNIAPQEDVTIKNKTFLIGIGYRFDL